MDVPSTPFAYIVVCCLIRHVDSYLFIEQGKPGGAYPGTLHLPGGNIQAGESPDAAVRREVWEETGISALQDLQPFDFDWDETMYKGQRSRLVYLRFTARTSTEEATARSDAHAIYWIHRAELESQHHNEPTRRMLQRVGLIKPTN